MAASVPVWELLAPITPLPMPEMTPPDTTMNLVMAAVDSLQELQVEQAGEIKDEELV